MVAPSEISETITDVDEESTGVANEERTGVETSGNGEITGVPNTEDNGIASIDAAIVEVAATLDQELR